MSSHKEFTYGSFISLLKTFLESGYEITTVEEYLRNKDADRKVLILRHDVDRYPENTMHLATLEHQIGVHCTYYFRIIPSVYKEDIIKKVHDMGHEVAYHYEDLSLVKGNYKDAIAHFEKGLNMIRKFAKAETICMHGSPMSKWDNKKIWEKYNYRDYGIIGATSFDIDYNKVFYISDNGWGWNNTKVSVRDKVSTHFDIPIKNTEHLKSLVSSGSLPDQVMINAHPDTFFDPGFKWWLNKILIKSKNIVKRIIVKYKIFK